MKKILIIGKKSFIGSNLKKFLSNKFKIDHFSYEKIDKKSVTFFNKYSHIINTSIHPNYINKKYNSQYDLDIKFVRKFKKPKFFYIFLNTRKIYSLKENISENSKIKPKNNYAKNKFITEKNLKIYLKKKLISLRISNIIGKRIHKNTRKGHNLFFDNFLNYKKNYKIKKKKLVVLNDFKDFLSIDQFCKIVSRIIQLKINGIYNVSISKKIYIAEILGWLDQNFLENIKLIQSKKDSFTLSNKNLIKKIKINITKQQLKKFCQNLI